MVCELCNITTLHITFISNLFCKYGKNLLSLQDKRKQQPKHINSTNPNIMIIKHFTGGGYRLLLPPSMQCVARAAILITVSVTPVCKSEIL